MKKNRMQRVLACQVTSFVIWCACSAILIAEEPPRRLPLPIEVVAVSDNREPDTLTTGHSAVTPTDPGLQSTATLIPCEEALDDRASAIALTAHTESMPISSEGGPLRIGQLRATGAATSPHARSGGTGLSKVVASLAVVLGLLFGFVWASRKLGTSRTRGLPDEVVQVLGQFPLGGRQQATVVRFGSKLLALSITPSGIETIGELDDHLEVESLTQLCLGSDTGAVPGRVRDAVDRYAAARGM